MNVVIIGNSAAAIGCAEALRREDADAAITIVASEPHHSYSRPLISYLLCGKTDEARMRYRAESFYKDRNITALLGETVTGLHPDQNEVSLQSGKRLPYDKLLVATGSSPFVPPIEGLDSVPRSHTFMTLDDARALEQAVTKESRVLILGAGLIGLKCAEGLHGRAGLLRVVDMAPQVLPSILDPVSAALVGEHLEAQGVELLLGQSVQRFDGATATLTGGQSVDFDVLVVAVGVRPNVSLVRDAGGEVARGIVTDRFQRTTLPDVYAAGDCTESFDISSGERRILALLPAAYMQGETAGLHMAGHDKPYDKAIPMNAMGLLGKHMITAGSYTGTCHEVRDGETYKRLYVDDGLLKGYTIVGDVSRAGIYTALIRERVPLNSIDFELIKTRPQLMAFSRSERVKKLGGVRA